jgi:hypothetical protein
MVTAGPIWSFRSREKSLHPDPVREATRFGNPGRDDEAPLSLVKGYLSGNPGTDKDTEMEDCGEQL